MTDIKLTDKQWTKIRDFIAPDPNAYVGKDEAVCRHFIEAVKWMSRSGASWRLLPKNTENGTRFTNASHVGASKGSENG